MPHDPNHTPAPLPMTPEAIRLALPACLKVPSPAKEEVPDRRPRRVGPEAAKADHLLSNAIEYLTDARRLPSGRVSDLSKDAPDVESLMILMSARQQVYRACPVIERRSSLGLFGMFRGRERRGR